MPKSKKKHESEHTVTAKTKSAATASTSSFPPPKAQDNDNNSFKYGQLLFDLTLQAVDLRDMLPLRLVNRYSRSFVDRQLFKHVTLRTERNDPSIVVPPPVKPIVTATGQRLPVPVLKSSPPLPGSKIVFEYLKNYAVALDLEMLPESICVQFGDGNMNLPHLQYLRLKSDVYGYHTLELSGCFGASTVVVLPAWKPFRGWEPLLEREITLGGMSKLVQHVTFTIDWRGPIQFLLLPENNTIKNEVWVTTHLRMVLGFAESESHHSTGHKRFLGAIARRLKAGVNLTLTGLERGSTKWAGNTYLGKAVEELPAVLRADLLRHCGVTQDELRYLNVKTWDKYASTLSSEQLAMESLPLPYVQSWRDKERKYREDVGQHTFLT